MDGFIRGQWLNRGGVSANLSILTIGALQVTMMKENIAYPLVTANGGFLAKMFAYSRYVKTVITLTISQSTTYAVNLTHPRA